MTGSTDRQADPGQVQEWADAFRSSGNRDVTARLLPDLNHLFVHDPDGSPSNYARLPAPIRMDPMAVGIVVEWLVRRIR